MTAVSIWIPQVVQAYRGGRGLALLFDYDGTLAPIVADPQMAIMPEATRRILSGLASLEGVTIGVLSGRALYDLEARVALPNAWYAGSVGMHVQRDGQEYKDGAIAEFDGLADTIESIMAGLFQWYPGTWMERKPGCVSIHYRTLTPLKAACFCDLARDKIFSEMGPKIRVRDVTRALEITLDGCWNKGTAVATILKSLAPHPFVLYAGDGANDVEAISVVNTLGGLSLGIGVEAPVEARFRLENPKKFTDGLSILLGELQSARDARTARLPDVKTPAHERNHDCTGST